MRDDDVPRDRLLDREHLIVDAVGPPEDRRVGRQRRRLDRDVDRPAKPQVESRVERELDAIVEKALEAVAQLPASADALAEMIDDFAVPEGYKVALTGEKEEMQESFMKLMFALVLSIVLIYMIMASQFESLVQPFIVMFISSFSTVK